MRPLVWAAIMACTLASTAMAQTARPPSDWEKMYNDVSAQLRAAQDRKSELAADNARLTTRVAQLQRQTDALTDRTLFLQAFYTGWASFMARNSFIWDQWGSFWSQSYPGLPDNSQLLFDPQWPIN
jgi:hypothetical protein